MIKAEATLDAGGFLNTLKGMSHGVESVGLKFAVLTKDFEGFSMIAEKAEMIMDRFRESIKLGSELNSLALQTGQAVGHLMMLRQAFASADMGAEEVQPVIERLQENLSGLGSEAGAVDDALHRIGLSASQLRGQSTVEQLESMQKGFERLTDATVRAATAKAIFGRGGGRMLSIIGDPESLEVAAQQVGSLGGLMQRMAPTFDKINVAIGGISLKFEQLSTGFLSELAPQMGLFADAFNRIDLTGIGVGIGIIAHQGLEFALDVVSGVKLAIHAFSELRTSIIGIAPVLSLLTSLAKDFSDEVSEKLKAPEKSALGIGPMMSGFVPTANTPVSSLQRVGGGSGFGGGDPALQEARAQTLEWREANRNLKQLIGAKAGTPSHPRPRAHI
jgi:hypothetical protein